MRNKKGFTLIEVLAAIIILGILLVITVPTFTKYLKGFRLDYYERLEGNINTSGQTFFADNRSYRPIGLLETSIVKLGTLDSEHYIEDVTDYNGASCDDESYVIVIKEGKGKYHYEACLKCSKDDYSSGRDYCNEAWKNNDNLEYVLEEGPVIYVYQGTPRSELKEKLKIKAWVQKTDGMGNILATIDGREDETGEVPEIYPDDIDTVNTDVIGEYPVTYTYGSKTTTGKVIVYNNDAPIVNITKTNNGTTTPYDYTDSEDWGQQLNFKFSVVDSSELNELEQSGSSITAIQWRRTTTKKWEDFCTNIINNSCEVSTDIEMNENVKFRFVTDDTDYSGNTIDIKIRIDNTAPLVDFTKSGTKGLDDWYRSNITYGFDTTKTKDIVGDSGDAAAVSGLKSYGMSTTNPATGGYTFNLSSISSTSSQTVDTSGTTWYIYVEDKAENRSMPATDLAKRDTVDPYAVWDPSSGGPYHDTDAQVVKAYCTDDLSGARSRNDFTTTLNERTSSSGREYSIDCIDTAGNTSTPKKTYYVQYYSADEGACGCDVRESWECCDTCSEDDCTCADHATDRGCQSGCTGSCSGSSCCWCTTHTYECNCTTCYGDCIQPSSCWHY